MSFEPMPEKKNLSLHMCIEPMLVFSIRTWACNSSRYQKFLENYLRQFSEHILIVFAFSKSEKNSEQNTANRFLKFSKIIFWIS